MPQVSVEREAKRELPISWTRDVEDYVTALELSSDGTLAAVGTAAGMLWTLDLTTGDTRRSELAHAGGVLGVAWSPRARLLLSAGQDGSARLWDAAGSELARLPGTSPWVEHVAWEPSGKRLATASGRIARVWTAEGEPVLETEPHESTITGLGWNHRGTLLATACYGGVRLFSVDSGVPARHLGWRGSLISLAWSPSGSAVACATQENSVHFWRLPSGRDSEMSGFPSKLRALAWDAEGKLLATGGDSDVTVWSFDGKGPEGKAPISLSAHRALCTALAFHPKLPRLASGSDDMGVIVWEPRRAQSPVAFGFLEETVTAVRWALGGRLLVAADALGKVRAWRAE